ncbi:amidohydrolase family protein [Streptomyces acidicola]|uniref:amidohydrolase family protein n=1 Tax=Streptomyces acidicola TaxID=2596892 RepID=UPI00382DB34F
MSAIDCWTNPFTPQLLHRMYVDCEELNQIVKWWDLDERLKGFSPAAFVTEMDRLGIGKVCVPNFQMQSYITKQLNLDFSIEDIQEIRAVAPDRIHGLVGINPLKRMEGVRELRRAVDEYGFVGAHLHPQGYGLDLDDRDLYPFYAACSELGIPVLIQTGHSAERMPSRHGRPIGIDEVALYFPDLRLILGHTGWPWCEEAIAMAWKHENVYIATTAHAPKYWDKSLVRFLDSRGRGKVMWGTDFPVLTHEDALKQVTELGLKPASQQALLYDVAEQVFWGEHR